MGAHTARTTLPRQTLIGFAVAYALALAAAIGFARYLNPVAGTLIALAFIGASIVLGLRARRARHAATTPGGAGIENSRT